MENRHGLQWDHYTLKFTILTNSQLFRSRGRLFCLTKKAEQHRMINNTNYHF